MQDWEQPCASQKAGISTVSTACSSAQCEFSFQAQFAQWQNRDSSQVTCTIFLLAGKSIYEMETHNILKRTKQNLWISVKFFFLIFLRMWTRSSFFNGFQIVTQVEKPKAEFFTLFPLVNYQFKSPLYNIHLMSEYSSVLIHGTDQRQRILQLYKSSNSSKSSRHIQLFREAPWDCNKSGIKKFPSCTQNVQP